MLSLSIQVNTSYLTFAEHLWFLILWWWYWFHGDGKFKINFTLYTTFHTKYNLKYNLKKQKQFSNPRKLKILLPNSCWKVLSFFLVSNCLFSIFWQLSRISFPPVRLRRHLYACQYWPTRLLGRMIFTSKAVAALKVRLESHFVNTGERVTQSGGRCLTETV